MNNNQSSSKNPATKPVVSLVVLAFLTFAGVFLAASNERAILDWIKLRGYQSPTNVALIASQDTMTGYARKIFYVNRPGIEPKATFNNFCSNASEQTIVIGCYHPDQQGIYILKVSDKRLSGVEQVTAAHEMLHAGYDRLSAKEKTKVDALLLNYYHNDLHDQRILKTIAGYKKTEPNAVVSEMHSVFGTEIVKLPAGLEDYYKQYFSDRSKIARYAQSYEYEFTSREAKVKNYDTQLARLKKSVDSQKSMLQSLQAKIESLRAQMEGYSSSGQISQYNSLVPQYNSMVETYNNEVQTLKSDIASYNSIVKARNAIVFEEQNLSNAINSNVQGLSAY